MGLFDRLFGQEENQSQETVANGKFQKLRPLIIKTCPTSEGTSQSQTEQLGESETQVEKISSTSLLKKANLQ